RTEIATRSPTRVRSARCRRRPRRRSIVPVQTQRSAYSPAHSTETTSGPLSASPESSNYDQTGLRTKRKGLASRDARPLHDEDGDRRPTSTASAYPLTAPGGV